MTKSKISPRDLGTQIRDFWRGFKAVKGTSFKSGLSGDTYRDLAWEVLEQQRGYEPYPEQKYPYEQRGGNVGYIVGLPCYAIGCCIRGIKEFGEGLTGKM